MLFGVFLIVLGGLFLLENMGWLPAGVWGVFWPLVLIVLGLRLVMGKNGCCFNGGKFYHKVWHKKAGHKDESSESN